VVLHLPVRGREVGPPCMPDWRCDAIMWLLGKGDDGRGSLVNFVNDMGLRPAGGMSIDRVDNDGHYSCGKCDECVANGWPANCRWATAIEQGTNRRNNRILEYGGRRMTISQWERELGLGTNVISVRLADGWSVTEALETPAARRSPNKLTRGLLEYNGTALTIPEWASLVGISANTLYGRLHRGYTPEQILTKSVNKYERIQ
jgi:hypothetical protein